MKTKYVLLTAVSALMVATGANAKTEVATRAYTDSHLATGTISAPTGQAGKVVTVNNDGDGFIYTNKGDTLPTTDVENGDVLTWDGESWVAGEDADTKYTAGEAINISEDNVVSVKYDNETITKNTDGELVATTYDTFTASDDDTTAGNDGLVPGAKNSDKTKFLRGDGTWVNETTYDTFTSAADGLVPAADGTGETEMFLKGDGTWATPAQVVYDAGDGVAKSDDNKFSVKAVTDGGITVTSDGVSVDKDAVLGADGCGANQRCALVVTTDASGNPAGYTWEQLTEPDGEVQQTVL